MTSADSVSASALFSGGSARLGAIRDLHDTLLQPTLANAARTPFYRSLWHGIGVGGLTVETLSELPIVRKDDLLDAGRDAQVRQGLVCNEVFTSGTTGVPLVTVRGDREQRYIHDFFLEVNRAARPRRLLRGLQINNPYHGYHVGIPTPIHFHRIGIYDSGSFDYGRSVLASRHEDDLVEPRCSVLLGLERCLRAFTFDTELRHPAGLETKLSCVVSYSQYLTASWRRRLENTWSCPVVDRFSVTEVFGGASSCAACGWWHFDPFVMPEVVGAENETVVVEGRGLLLLSALYPFQEAQPLVRYATGDLVETTSSESCLPGTVAIRPLGRARFGVRIPGTENWLLTPASVLEAVDDVQEVARVPRFLDSEQVSHPFAIGHPKYRVSASAADRRVLIRLELQLRDGVDAHAFGVVSSRVRDRLLVANPTLGRELALGSCVLDVVRVSDLRPALIAHAE